MSPATRVGTPRGSEAWARRTVLALDFDGVIGDGFLECALVTWNTHFRRPVQDFGPEGLARIPESFLNRFRQARGHARHLGHFLVPVLAGSAHLRTQKEFDACYAGLPSRVVEDFVEEATRYREAARSRFPDRWLGYHRMYDGVVDVLTSAATRWYVVTAKDSNSVLEILAAHGVRVDASQVYGERTHKAAALADIARREDVAAADIQFFDDNLPNVVAARNDGYDAHWATWGFHTAEHVSEARRLRIPSTDLPAFPRVVNRRERDTACASPS